MNLYLALLSLTPCHEFFLDRTVRHDVVEQRLLTYFILGPVAKCKECLFNDLILPPGNYATEKRVLYMGVGPGYRSKPPKDYKVYIWTTNKYCFSVYCTSEGDVFDVDMMNGTPL